MAAGTGDAGEGASARPTGRLAPALVDMLARATGPDPDLDAAIAAQFGGRPADPPPDPPPYTGSVDACIDLVHAQLAGWGWHVGFGPSGVLPYAALHDDTRRVEASAPTVPLALLRALVAALAAVAKAGA
jgi:hypothetical protein